MNNHPTVHEHRHPARHLGRWHRHISGTPATSERGQVVTIVAILFTAAMTAITGAIISPTVRSTQMGTDFLTSKQSYFTAEAGSEDAYYRIRNNLATSFPAQLALNNATATISVSTISATEQEIRSEAQSRNLVRAVTKTLTSSDAYTFLYAVQSGLGGFYLYNNAVINGDVYANGPVVGNSSTIRGAVVSAGSTGLVNGIHSTSSVYARTIQNATIDGNAYYQSFNGATSSVTVLGTKYPNSADQPTTTMPISDTLITQWETDASNGGSVTCSGATYTINSSVTIGPRKIPCNLSITGNGTIVTLTGTLWVTGNITMNGSGGSGVQIRVSDSIGNKSVAMIAHKTTDTLTSSQVTISGNSNYYGSTGNADSNVMVVSMNRSAETGGSALAIDVSNGAAGNLLVYAPHGEIKLSNSVVLREVTAYKLSLYNNSVVNYSLGLGQSLYTFGQGGTWKIRHWRESI